MTLTIDLTPAEEARLAAAARRQGAGLADVMKQLVTEHLPPAERESSVELTEQEKWLYENPEALDAVKRGLADSAAGRGVKMSFLEYADSDIND